MSEPREDAIRTRLETATPGPWVYGGLIGSPGEPLRHYVLGGLERGGDGVDRCLIVSLSTEFAADDSGLDKNQRFIAAAPTDVAWLLTELERVRAERDAAEQRHLQELSTLDALRHDAEVWVSRLQEALREMTARYGRPATESGGPFL